MSATELAVIARNGALIWRLGAARREMERRWDPWAAVRRVLAVGTWEREPRVVFWE